MWERVECHAEGVKGYHNPVSVLITLYSNSWSLICCLCPCRSFGPRTMDAQSPKFLGLTFAVSSGLSYPDRILRIRHIHVSPVTFISSRITRISPTRSLRGSPATASPARFKRPASDDEAGLPQQLHAGSHWPRLPRSVFRGPVTRDKCVFQVVVGDLPSSFCSSS